MSWITAPTVVGMGMSCYGGQLRQLLLEHEGARDGQDEPRLGEVLEIHHHRGGDDGDEEQA